MSEVALVPELLNPVSGELVRTDDLPALAAALETLDEAKATIADAKAQFTLAAVEHSRLQGTKTLHAGEYEVSLSADTAIEWDVELLGRELREAGLPEDRVNALIVAEVSYKIDGRVVRQLESASETYAAIIARARTKVPKTQYARVRRA